jgi:hypothetical protein
MRELTVRIRFTKASLGNVKRRGNGGALLLPRNPQGFVTFLASWHRANLRFAAQVLGRHQDVVDSICWDIAVDGEVRKDSWHRRHYVNGNGRKVYALHESFKAGQEVGINCVVPQAVNDDDLRQLMQIAGQYKGLSPYKAGDFGFFEVVSVRPRRRTPDPDQGGNAEDEVVEQRTAVEKQ